MKEFFHFPYFLPSGTLCLIEVQSQIGQTLSFMYDQMLFPALSLDFHFAGKPGLCILVRMYSTCPYILWVLATV